MTAVRHQSSSKTLSNSILKGRALRLVLLSGVSAALPCLMTTAQAQDVTVSDARTTSIETSTADGGAAANVIIDTAGSVTVASGTAVTVDSDNDLTVDGSVTVDASDNSSGVLLTPGFSGTYSQDGDILLDQSQAQIDADAAGDDPVDYNDNRAGILLDSGGTFTGDLTLTAGASIGVFGDMSAGLRLLGDLDGSVNIDGDFSVNGEDSQGAAISGNVSGDVIFGSNSNFFINGVGANGVMVDGSIDGAFVFGGTVQLSAYTDLIPDPDNDPDNDNDAQRGRQSGASIDIRGDVGGGVLINGGIPANQLPDGETNPPAAQVTSFSSSAALLITGGATINLVDTSGLVDPAAYGSFGVINRGALISQAIYDDLVTQALVIDDATIMGGVRNDNTISATGRNGDSVGVTVRSGASVPTIFNNGIINIATVGTEGNTATAFGILIQDTSTVNSITNNNLINASTLNDTGDAVAIRDTSGSVSQVTNSGTIAARVLDESTDGNTLAPTGQAIAFDFSANSTGLTITNTVSADFSGTPADRENFGVVLGDVLLGSGDDSYIANAGSTAGDLFLGAGNDTVDLSQMASISGDIDFNSGDDTLTVSNGSVTGNLSFGTGADALNFSDGTIFTGQITDSDDALDITLATNSVLNFADTALLNLSSLSVDATSTLGIAIADQGTATSLLNVSGTALFEDGATINPIFLGAVPNGSFSSTIVSAGTLNADPSMINVGDANGNTPFLFNFDVSSAGNDLVLGVNRKAASELGVAPSLEAAIDPTIAALNQDLALGTLIFNLTTQEDFQSAFGQLVAGPLDAPLTYARAQTNSVTSIITQRLDMARNSGEYGRTFWIQEEGYYVNRGADAASNGFDGGGFAIAAGVDAGLEEGLDAIGLSASFSSARYDEQTGEDFPFNRVTYGVGAYGAASFGNLQIDGRAEYAISDSDSERNVAIGNIRRLALGKWEGTQISASGRVSYETKVSDFSVEPFASLDWLSLDEDAYTETNGGDGVNLSVDQRTADSLRANFGVKAGKVYEVKPNAYDTGIPGTLHPQFTVAWSSELNTDPIEATYTYAVGGDSFTLSSNPEDGAALIGADVAYENEYAKVHIGASGTFGDTTETFILRAGVGLKW